ncbi:MAG: hypothetical protein RMJ34_05020 [candidate division WOR-3 bacterium]|nr:hypothetical protein [candidate division WOR-3 bacterium]MDW8114277.1 hypothetical protein [candidate division WOR-3 bacterium]
MYKKLIAILILFSITLLFAKTFTSNSGKKVFEQKWIEYNRWRYPLHNDGRFGFDATGGGGTGAAGGSWPRPLRNFYIFGAGIWIGAISPQGETLVSCGYDPNSGASELWPVIHSRYDGSTGTADDCIYYFPDKWPPPKDKFPMAPQDTVSGMDVWCCFSDAHLPAHKPGDTKPIGVDVYLTGYHWNLPSNRDIFFLKYEIKNVSGDTLKNMYLGVVLDGDVGYYRDDMMAMVLDERRTPRKYIKKGNDSIFVDNLAWIYDSDNRESPGTLWERGVPGAVAYDFLQSPYALKDNKDNDEDGLIDLQEIDSAYICGLPDTLLRDSDNDNIPAWRDFSEIEQLGMTSCKMFTLEQDPKTDVEKYLTLAGYQIATREYKPYDNIDETPGDKRFLQSTGPFDLPPDSIATLVVAVIAAKYGEEGQPFNQRDTWDLARVSAEAQRCYDKNWLLPAPPFPPVVTAMPQDNRVILSWDNRMEKIPDPYYRIAQLAGDTTYREYDFEGYKIYKSLDGVEWELKAICDLKNGIKYADTFKKTEIIRGDTVYSESIFVWANDKGTFYYYVDDSVINGYTYYYAVTSFDYNKTWGKTLILESGIQAIEVTPRKEVANYQKPSSEIKMLIGDSLNNKFKFDVIFTAPYLTKDTQYLLTFLDPICNLIDTQPIYQAIITKLDYSETLVTCQIPYTLGKKEKFYFPSFDGTNLVFTMELDSAKPEPFVNVEIKNVNGNYPAESLKLLTLDRQPFLKVAWAFRGSDYRLVWGRKPEGGLTLKEVYDLTNKVEVKYDSLFNMWRVGYGNCWAFLNGTAITTRASDTLRNNEFYIYIPGGYIQIRKGGPINPQIKQMIQPGDTWYIYSNKTYGTAPSYNKFIITTTAMRFTDMAGQKLNVKVVPNPYIITNKWEKTTLARRLQFVNLPDECVIRIFNLAGDLVKIIEHKSSEKGTKNNKFGGTAEWNLLNQHNQKVASGVYIFHVDSKYGKQIGKFAIIM